MTKGINQDYFSEEGVDYTTPIDILEPIDNSDNPYRENALAFLRVMSLALSYITDADDSLAASWGVVFAMGLASVTDNRTMAQIAREIGCTRATISNHAKKAQRILGLPESPLQKSEEAVVNSRRARNKYCEENL